MHKPTNPFPYNTVVNLDDYPENLSFSASVYNSSPITNARLKINVANNPYYFSPNSTAYTIVWKIDQSIYEDPSEWPSESSSAKYLWDSWLKNWIRLDYPSWNSFKSYHTFEYNSNTDTVVATGWNRSAKNEVTYKWERCKARRTTSPYTKSYYQLYDDSNYKNSYNYMAKYTQSFSKTSRVFIGQSHSNGNDTIYLSCGKGKAYESQTVPTDESTTPVVIYDKNNALLQPNSDYSWQVRLYEDADTEHPPSNCLGYGFVNAKGTPLKLRPHTTIEYNKVIKIDGVENKYYQFSSLEGASTSEKYYISINGKVGQITEFWNSDMSISEISGKSVSTTTPEADSYGDPLYGYAQIEWGTGSTPTINVGTQYAIFCNYVDSDEFYFSTTENCKLSLSDDGHTDDRHKDEEGNPMTVTDIDDDTQIYVHRSDFHLSGEYAHTYGAIASRYRVLLYKAEDDIETLVDDTDYIQDSYISYAYNRMVNGERYRLDIEVVDTNGYSIQRSVDITINYSDIVIDIPDRTVRTDSYPQHNSIIVDWSNTLEGFISANNDSRDFLGFDVYKTIGEKDKLYQVASRNTTGIIEDFLVGDRVEYVYYIYPVYMTADGERIQPPLISESITLSHGRMKLVGLNSIDNDNNIYAIDTDNLWVFGLDLSDNGTTVVNSKTFTDTLSRYSKETVGSTQYVTKQVGGLLGKIDCSNENAAYLDTYDNIVDWRDFVGGSQLKAFVDLRGVIYICDTEANPTDSYNENLDYATSVTFTIHEIDSLDYLSVFARDLNYNPRSFILLADGYDELLRSKEPESLYLATERTDAS